jgi:DNA-binding MarR family transcriptional regulator
VHIKTQDLLTLTGIVVPWVLNPVPPKDAWAWYSETVRERPVTYLAVLTVMLLASVCFRNRSLIKERFRKPKPVVPQVAARSFFDVSAHANAVMQKAMAPPEPEVIQLVVPTSLPQNEVDVLKVFKFQHTKSMPILQLAGHLGASESETRKIVGRMSKQGLVKFDPLFRAQPVTLTAMGETWLDDHRT